MTNHVFRWAVCAALDKAGVRMFASARQLHAGARRKSKFASRTKSLLIRMKHAILSATETNNSNKYVKLPPIPCHMYAMQQILKNNPCGSLIETFVERSDILGQIICSRRKFENENASELKEPPNLGTERCQKRTMKKFGRDKESCTLKNFQPWICPGAQLEPAPPCLCDSLFYDPPIDSCVALSDCSLQAALPEASDFSSRIEVAWYVPAPNWTRAPPAIVAPSTTTRRPTAASPCLIAAPKLRSPKPVTVSPCPDRTRKGIQANHSEDIIKLVNDTNLKTNAQDYLKKFKYKYISVALDKVQRNTCTIGEATEIWLELLEAFETEQANGEFLVSDTNKVKERMEMASTPPAHFLANLLDHRFREAFPIIINYQAKCAPFEHMFSKHLIENENSKVKPLAWWRSMNNINTTSMELAQQLHTAIALSANIERLFSSYGSVHSSELRNRLGNVKAAKLVSILKELYSISDDVTDEIDDYEIERV
ncbi:unnamed protein product [Phaedon cochleariae]|uniref:HAT C-terminal dimerisation domain-containing protein n=1 Tax=Phaedon cochleariae TaxID=80249 RepID=A0A9N9X298_PHACE|nr:unnamed protein product [Phaedon cochleariae]